MIKKKNQLPKVLLNELDEERIMCALVAHAEKEGEALNRQNEELSTLPEYQPSTIAKQQFHRILCKTVAHKWNTRRAVLLIAALLAAILLTGTALSANLFDFIIREFTGYVSVSNNFFNTNSTNNYCVWSDSLSPAYLPSGYQYSSHEDSGQVSITEYMDREGNIIIFSQFSGTSQLLIDTDGTDQKQYVYINEQEGTIISKEGVNNLIWGTSPQYQLIGSCDSDELIKMAQSVTILK